MSKGPRSEEHERAFTKESGRPEEFPPDGLRPLSYRGDLAEQIHGPHLAPRDVEPDPIMEAQKIVARELAHALVVYMRFREIDAFEDFEEELTQFIRHRLRTSTR